eukprot:COSAG04_NODE_31387_length_257_cov_0.645570_1_plen_62_part_10
MLWFTMSTYVTSGDASFRTESDRSHSDPLTASGVKLLLGELQWPCWCRTVQATEAEPNAHAV